MEITARMTSMLVVAETDDAVYVRLSDELQRDAGGCSCEHCKKNPALAKWDTLVVPKKLNEHTYTVHMPNPAQFRAYIENQRTKTRTKEAMLPHNRWEK